MNFTTQYDRNAITRFFVNPRIPLSSKSIFPIIKQKKFLLLLAKWISFTFILPSYLQIALLETFLIDEHINCCILVLMETCMLSYIGCLSMFLLLQDDRQTYLLLSTLGRARPDTHIFSIHLSIYWFLRKPLFKEME